MKEGNSRIEERDEGHVAQQQKLERGFVQKESFLHKLLFCFPAKHSQQTRPDQEPQVFSSTTNLYQYATL